MSNRLRSAFAPKRSKNSNAREIEYREEFLASARLAKEAIRSIIEGNAESVTLGEDEFYFASYSIPVGSYAFNVKDSRKIAYEGIRRYGIDSVNGITRYARIPGTKSDARRFTEAFEILRFHFWETDEDGTTILRRNFPSVGEIVEEIPVILSVKEGIDVSEWDWDDEITDSE